MCEIYVTIRDKLAEAITTRDDELLSECARLLDSKEAETIPVEKWKRLQFDYRRALIGVGALQP